MIQKARTRSRGGSFAAAATSKKGWAACAESPVRVPQRARANAPPATPRGVSAAGGGGALDGEARAKNRWPNH